jgi:hypothetical protein
MLHAEPGRVVDEVLAAANHCTDAIWLESVKVQTSEPSTSSVGQESPLASLDLKSMLDSLRESPEVLKEARAALEVIKGKLPAIDLPTDVFSDESISNLVREARELLVSSGLSSEERSA